MITYFGRNGGCYYAVESDLQPERGNIEKLSWLFAGAVPIEGKGLSGRFLGPRREMVTPWSTNAVEITQNMGISEISRIEELLQLITENSNYDRMLQHIYENPGQDIFTIARQPEPVIYIEDISGYNQREGLALSPDEIQYLEYLAEKLKRQLTDSEIFGFSQVNSEHCRHKIFNGTFIIDGEEMPSSLFQLIKKTTQLNPNRVVSAYKDNCAFLHGPEAYLFAPATQDKADFFNLRKVNTVLSLKAETHNFPTTVEPFNGAATGTGGEIRDRLAGGKGSMALAGTAVYMTSYPRLSDSHTWEKHIDPRPWLYQSPADILIKASNGASDFGNKFGQPLICGSVLTFEHTEAGKNYGFDKVIMLAGGVGYGLERDVNKGVPEKGDKIVLLGGDNYRIGMGGGAVSSVATGEYSNAIELNAVQRSNPEMQKRVANAIRAMCEADHNPVISIHDHGAGGHLNCLSELVEKTGGFIDMDSLPVGDPTLSAREIAGNESQERMGLVMKETDALRLKKIADRERAPIYIIGEATGDHRFTFESKKDKVKPIDLALTDMFGNPPRTVMKDFRATAGYQLLQYDIADIYRYIEQVLRLEAVACKDWLTNKVDRSVTGRVALQQSTGAIQLPLNNLGISAIDYAGYRGIATSIGHAPVAGIINPGAGSRLAIAEALTNIVFTPLEEGLKGVSLSANWMWPCRNPGEDARLYDAVKSASDFALALQVNIPTGKDSLSMAQKYPDGSIVYSPGTVIISAAGESTDFRKTVTPDMKLKEGGCLVYIPFATGPFKLGGSSFAQSLNLLGNDTPDVTDAVYFARVFGAVQVLINHQLLLAGHDVSAGGLVTTLLEMVFPLEQAGMELDLSGLGKGDFVTKLFSENPGIVIQTALINKTEELLTDAQVRFVRLGKPTLSGCIEITDGSDKLSLPVATLRDTWFSTSRHLDAMQTVGNKALERYKNYKNQPLKFIFPNLFTGCETDLGIDRLRNRESGIKAAIIREKGVNGDREMAWMMHLAGFDVKDVHMTDLINGHEDLSDVNMIVFVGGFSNSDVLGSAKGWAGAFLYNPQAAKALENFYKRSDTLSLGVCNGCQLMMELNLVYPHHDQKPYMSNNESHKFESAFINVEIIENHSIMLGSLAGSRLGIWVAHGEGKFNLPYNEEKYHIPMKYSYNSYPGNPNGSRFATAALCSGDGRHLVMMPHLERSTYPWNWAYYPKERNDDEISPWMQAFVNAREWIVNKVK